MPAPILTTKLHIPAPRPNLVVRLRLLTRLNEGLTSKLTLVCAPAGFGKTTLVSHWLLTKAEGKGLNPLTRAGDEAKIQPSFAVFSLQPSRVAWLSLDDGDNDPAHFMSHLVAALAKLAPEIDRSIKEILANTALLPAEPLVTDLINAMADLPPDPPLVFVLDDYHLLTATPVHQAVTFLLDHLPPALHLVITSRTDPPLPLARLRARGQLTELREADLRFTLDEAAAFLNQMMHLNLSAADIAALDASTEGWAAGLQLAGLSLQNQPDYSAFLQTFHGSHRHIFDYLAAEVLKQQPAHIQTFLQQTSVLKRLTAPLCDAVLENSAEFPPISSQEILDHLERANLFIIPLDDERRWYRYHHLFAEFLQTCLQQTQPDLAPELHHRAATWQARHGLPANAVRHALAAGDFDLAAELIDQEADQVMKQGELITLREWLEALPLDHLHTRPGLSLLYGWILLFNLQTDEAEALLTHLSEHLAPPAELTHADIAAEMAAMRVWIAIFRGDPVSSAAFAQQTQEYAEVKSPFVRSMIAMNQIFPAMLSGDVPAALQACADAVQISREAGNILVTVVSMCQQAEVTVMAGQLHRAADIYRQALPLALSPSGQPLPTAGVVHIGLSLVLYEWNDLEAAARHLAQGFELTKQMGEIVSLDGYMLQVRLKQSQGDPAGAAEVIRHAQMLVEQTSTDLDNWMVAIQQTRLWLRQGNLEAAGRWAQDYIARANADTSYMMREFEELTLARVYIAQNRPAEALAVLLPLLQTTEQWGRITALIETLALQALAYQAQNDLPRAVAALTSALILAEPEGYIHIFVDEGEPMQQLLQRMKAHEAGGRVNSYIQKLLQAFIPHPSPLPYPHSSLLSEREVEVLQLIAEGMSNQQIAETLVIAIGTVKKHLNNIYDKLQVRSRTQAVARARELQLL